MKIDILKNEFYITSFRRVLRNYVPQRKIIHTEGRRFDAFLLVLNGGCEYRFRDGTSFTVNAGDVDGDDECDDDARGDDDDDENCVGEATNGFDGAGEAVIFGSVDGELEVVF